ncbi:MAG: hypothetical protein CJBNEKGG_00343 [Prosthecobacter sp.]|nr:hypothetical protein [Prosthecobacter sp.]
MGKNRPDEPVFERMMACRHPTVPMSRAVIQSLLAILMAVPLHFCCWLGLMDRQEEGGCMACHQFLEPEERPLQPAPSDRHCECCDGTLQRDAAPLVPTVPRPVLVELSFMDGELGAEVSALARSAVCSVHALVCEHPPPRNEAPLYQRHCRLLI